EVVHSAGVASTAIDKEFELYIGDEITLHGHWDQVDILHDERLRIVAYRSGKLRSRPEYLRGSFVPVQALAALEELRRPLAVVEVVSLRELKPLRTGVQIARWQFQWEDGSELALTDERLNKLQTEIKMTAQSIRTGSFDAKPERDRCSSCRFRQMCDRAWGRD